MNLSFPRTLRSMRVDRSPGMIIAFGLIGCIIALWCAWLVLGRVGIYAVSSSSRVEADRASHAIQSVYTGRIANNRLVMGQRVKQGDVLMELDANIQQLMIIEERTQGLSLASELAALDREIAAEEQAMREEERAARLGDDEAAAKQREAEAALRYAAAEAERKSKLFEAGLISQLESERAKTDLERQRAIVEGFQHAISRREPERLARASERQSRVEALKRERNRLSGMKNRLGASVDRLKSEMELRRIYAPVDGVIGEVAPLRIGAVVAAGERLGAIVPEGALKVVAQFDPSNAIGRIRNGQRAQLRLDGFPWTQYGTVAASVTTVANEVRDGSVRIELRPASDSRVTLQHGLPGTTEIKIEEISPARLLLRIGGQMLGPIANVGRKAPSQNEDAQ